MALHEMACINNEQLSIFQVPLEIQIREWGRHGHMNITEVRSGAEEEYEQPVDPSHPP
jgi:hypothetical protein